MTKDEQWLLAEKYGGEKSSAFFADCERLKAGEPLAYVIGHVPFLNCTMYLDSHPLIPRPETEFWVEKVIAEIRGAAASPPRILDLCAGSGCIGVAIAKALPNAHITFAEIEASHLPTITKNLTANSIDNTRFLIRQSDLFENVPGTFDVIVSNPPYIDPAFDRVEPSVKNYEPSVALYGGRRGSEIIERIIAAAPAHLSPTGTLYLEHEPEQAGIIADLATKHSFVTITHPDQYNVLRYSTLTRTE